MEAALGWIGRVVEFLISLLPHLYTVDADSRAVKYPRGVRPVEQGPGLHLYWPVVTNEPTIICTTRRTNLLNAQRLTTSDGYTVIISLGVVGRVEDVVKAVHETQDFDDDINQAALRAVTPVVLRYSWTELTERIVSGKFTTDVKRKAVTACRPYGYKVEEVFVADWCEAKVFAIVGESSPILPAGGDDE